MVSTGTTLAYSALPTLILRAVPAGQTASANGVNVLMRTIGQAISSAAVAAVLVHHTRLVGGAPVPTCTAICWPSRWRARSPWRPARWPSPSPATRRPERRRRRGRTRSGPATGRWKEHDAGEHTARRPSRRRPPGATPRATKAAILRAARHLLARHAHADITLKAVAERAGVSPPLVVKYFGNKDALFARVMSFEEDAEALLDAPPDELGRHMVRHVLVSQRERGADPVVRIAFAPLHGDHGDVLRANFRTQVTERSPTASTGPGRGPARGTRGRHAARPRA